MGNCHDNISTFFPHFRYHLARGFCYIEGFDFAFQVLAIPSHNLRGYEANKAYLQSVCFAAGISNRDVFDDIRSNQWFARIWIHELQRLLSCGTDNIG